MLLVIERIISSCMIAVKTSIQFNFAVFAHTHRKICPKHGVFVLGTSLLSALFT